jgi:hypothetical protein
MLCILFNYEADKMIEGQRQTNYTCQQSALDIQLGLADLMLFFLSELRNEAMNWNHQGPE